MGTVPMLSPDGQSGDVPVANVQSAIKAGFKRAVPMKAPTGQIGYVPEERMPDAIKAGFVPQPIAPLPNMKMKTSITPQLVRGVTGSLPAIGGTAGGLVASPTVAGAAAGAGLGAGLGIEAKQLLNRALFGNQEPSTTSSQGLKELGTGMATSAATAGAIQGVSNYLTAPAEAASQDTRALNEAIGASQRSVRIGKDATSLEDAVTNPGRGLANAGFDVDTLKNMTPVERMGAVSPHWKAAGRAIGDAVQDATQAGRTVNVADAALDALRNVKNPQVQGKALDEFIDLAQEQGIGNLNAATPTEALNLRQALSPSANFAPTARFGTLGQVRAMVRGGVSSSLKDQVPALADLDQQYSDMRSAIDAIQRQVIKDAIKTPVPEAPSLLATATKTAVKKILPYAAVYAGARGLYKVGTYLKDVAGEGE